MKKFFAFIFLLISLSTHAQIDSTQFEQVRSLLNFYEYMLNAVGAEKSSTRDKEVIIRESYKKIFASDEVQIEDDLLADRSVITNKDVTAYLRDVDFFYRDIQFDFTETSINKVYGEDSSGYFLIEFESQITGLTLDGENHNRTTTRFIEVNYNEQLEDLKIASIYSTKVSREAELTTWWADLPFEWKDIFGRYVVYDSITLHVLLELASLDSLNLKGELNIQDLEPLTALKALRFLDISNTRIADLTSLRNARSLQELRASNTQISDISPLTFSKSLRVLNISNSPVIDITPLQSLESLKYINLSALPIESFEPLKEITALDSIDLSNTAFDNLQLLSKSRGLKSINAAGSKVKDLAGIQLLSELNLIDISNTSVSELSPLKTQPALQTLIANKSQIRDLSPLDGNQKLRKVYADYTGISTRNAAAFMERNPSIVVVTNSEAILQWWNTLPGNWKLIFSKRLASTTPGREELTKLLTIDSLDISNEKLYELEPLQPFTRLRHLDVSKNLFTSFGFCASLEDLQVLVANDLPVDNTEGLERNQNLRVLYLKGTLISSTEGLDRLTRLQLLNVDNTGVGSESVKKLLGINSSLTVIYRSEDLREWWETLSSDWKMGLKLRDPGSLELHRLTQQQNLKISDQPITSLEPLEIFIRLENIELSNLRIADLAGLEPHNGLKQLAITKGPLQSLEGIQVFKSLETLNIENTAIEDLRPLESLRNIRSLNCAGTTIKNLKGISNLTNLEDLNVSNTRIWKLQQLEDLGNLKRLVCFNTRLRSHTIEEFKTKFPDCSVDFY